MKLQREVFILAILTAALISTFLISNRDPKPEPLITSQMYQVPPDSEETYFIFLSGLDSFCDGTRYNQMGFGYLRRQLARVGLSYNDEHFLLYSYSGGRVRGGRWYPNPYGRLDTGRPIQFSVMQLEEMIAEFTRYHPRARFILVGHSLGGRIAFDYVSGLHPGKEGAGIVKGVITLNSPLAGSEHTQLHMLSVFKTVWGTPAVNQLVVEYQFRNELDMLQQKTQAARAISAEGVFLATFGTRQDLVVNPGSACLSDAKGHPLTKGSVVSVSLLSGDFQDLFGHRQILSHKKVAECVISAYLWGRFRPIREGGVGT